MKQTRSSWRWFDKANELIMEVRRRSEGASERSERDRTEGE